MGRRKREEVEIEEEYYEEDNTFADDMKKEITGIIIIALAIILGISFFYGDGSGTLLDPIHNGLVSLFGVLSIVFPIYLIIDSLLILRDPDKSFGVKFVLKTLFVVALVGAIPTLMVVDDTEIALRTGGYLGFGIAYLLYKIGGIVGGYVILVAIVALTFILLTKKSFIGFVRKGVNGVKENIHGLYEEDDDEEEVEAEFDENGQGILVEEKDPKKKHGKFNFLVDSEDEEEEDDDEDNENSLSREELASDEEDEEYEEDAAEEEKKFDLNEKPSFIKRLFGGEKSEKKKKHEDITEEVDVVGLYGKEESKEELAKAFEDKNEGIVDISIFEQTEYVESAEEESEEDEEYDEDDDGYQDESDNEEYEAYDVDEDDENEDYADEYATDDYEEDEEEEDDGEEIQIGLHDIQNATKIAGEVDPLANTPVSRPVATTDEYDDENKGSYKNTIVKKNPHRQKQEVKLIDEDGEEETIEIDDEPIDYVYPKMNLLNKVQSTKGGLNKAELKEKSKVLEETLKSFKVNASVVGVTKGPAVTRFELQLAVGVKVGTIQNLADDIALHMASSGVRIAPVPGKTTIGVEIANSEPAAVYMKEVLDTEEFRSAKSKIATVLGKSIDGKTILMDIAKLPHVLIAGATGSGKSVCINTIITSIMYKASPDEVKLIMVDPKVVELQVYQDIPHLLIPVVTDPKKAASALNWAVLEMESRYHKFADCNVRNLEGYNIAMEKAGKRKMPQIVIIIDELADLMMAAGKEVETSICRLAQKARAAGMHLIVATQRPSVDVVTGLIKTNIPSRIAFAVSSGIDSRTILDSLGAEKLLGRGDMLFLKQGDSKPTRIQGAFVSDEEVENITNFVKSHHSAHYSNDVIEKINRATEEKEKDGDKVPSKGDDDGDDESLVYDAVELINEKKKASISMFQRAFKIGYNRAANLMELLEQKGFVGPDEGTKPRKVYFDSIRDAMSYRD
ncbi:MAG: DNA translocase FtsK [Clostridia bacterium]|nr:DNA translocase FtsK [Clostridia bacterium]